MSKDIIVALNANDRVEFAEYLRALRAKSGLTQREVEKRCGISGAYLALLETGRRNPPSYKYLERLAQVYQADLDQVLSKAGYKQSWKGLSVTPERIGWAFDTAIRDPQFSHGLQIPTEDLHIRAKAFIVELYQRATDRILLTPQERNETINVANGMVACANDPIRRLAPLEDESFETMAEFFEEEERTPSLSAGVDEKKSKQGKAALSHTGHEEGQTQHKRTSTSKAKRPRKG